MALFDTEQFAQKLQQLAPTQQGIETLSKWCMFFKTELKKVVATWDVQFQAATAEKRLSFLRFSGPGVAKDIEKAKRLVDVWGERRVYSPNTIKQLHALLPAPARGGAERAPAAKRPKTSGDQDMPPPSPRDPVLDKRLQPMASTYAVVSKAEVQSNKLLLALSSVCRKGLENDGTISELAKAKGPLQQYTDALVAEVAGRQAVISALKVAVEEQEKGIKDAHGKLQLSKQHLQKVTGRLDSLREEHVKQFKAKQAFSQPLVASGPGDAPPEAGSSNGSGAGPSSGAGPRSQAQTTSVPPGAWRPRCLSARR
eukprot:jgi/Tetstr1/446743/TSEL_034230.t1